MTNSGRERARTNWLNCAVEQREKEHERARVNRLNRTDEQQEKEQQKDREKRRNYSEEQRKRERLLSSCKNITKCHEVSAFPRVCLQKFA